MAERLPFKEQKLLQRDWLLGMSEKDIREKYDLKGKSIQAYLNVSPATRTEIEKRFLETPIIRENSKIMHLKDELLDSIRTTLSAYNNLDNDLAKLKNAYVITDIISAIDRIQRLNNEKPTDITKNENTTKYVDVAETIKALKAPDLSREDKIKYVQEKLASNSSSS